MDMKHVGHQIETLQQLYRARAFKKSVVVPRHPIWGRRPMPAAVFMNLSGEIILKLFESGMYVYMK